MASMSSPSKSAALFLILNLLLSHAASSHAAVALPDTGGLPALSVSRSLLSNTTCSINSLSLFACINILPGLVNPLLGVSLNQKQKCCSLINGVLDLEAALCLCSAVKLSVLGVLNTTLSVNLILGTCGRNSTGGCA